MKDKILKFIENIKLMLNEKRKVMPKARFHQPHIDEINQDEEQLDSAYAVIEQLDETKPNLAARLLHHVIEMVIPIFSHWKERIKKTEAAHPTLREHITAKTQYETERSKICLLLENINTLNEIPLITVQPNIENPGTEIVKQYKQQRLPFLTEHGICDAVPNQMGNKRPLQ